MEKKLALEFIGIDYWSRPVYRTEDGRLFADTNCDSGWVNLYTLTGNNIGGEPNMSISNIPEYKDMKIKITGRENEPTKEEKHNYMMLGRLQSDCNYYLGNGGRYAPQLRAGDEKGQIEKMKELWSGFSDDKKPEWLTWEQILEYEKEMCK